MKKRVLSMLLALVMAFSLAVPAFAADEFAAEAPAIQEEEAPAAPVAEEPEAPAEEPEPAKAPDMPAEAAVEPDVPAEAAEDPGASADDEPDAGDETTYDGKLIIEGDESQIYAVTMFDPAQDWGYAGDPRKVGVAPGAQIEVWLKPGYTVKESEVDAFSWYTGEEDIPAADEDVVPAHLCIFLVPEEGGDMTVTIEEGGPALPETVPVIYKNDDGARFGCSPVAYKDSSRLNWVTYKPGYLVKFDGAILQYISPYIDGSALEAGYTVAEGAKGVMVEFVKSTGKLVLDAPKDVALEDIIYWEELYNGTNDEEIGETTWMGSLELGDICPGAYVDIGLSADYELEGFNKSLLIGTDIFFEENPESPGYNGYVRWYHIRTPEKGNLKLTVKEAKKVTVKYAGDTEGIVEKEEVIFPGQEFTFTLRRGYYASFDDHCGFNWDEPSQGEEGDIFVNHIGTDPNAQEYTVTIHKTDAVLRITEGQEFIWAIGMDDEQGWYTSPACGMKPGAHVYVAVPGNMKLEFVNGEPEDVFDNYEVIHEEWNEHDSELQHWYNINNVPDHDLEIRVVEGGEIPDPITVKFEGEVDAIHYTDDQVYPGGNLTLFVQDGYYLETTFSEVGFDPNMIDDEGDGCNGFNLNVWPEAEDGDVTVTVRKAAGKLELDVEDPAVLGWWAESDKENVRLSDPIQGFGPGAHLVVSVANGYAVELEGDAKMGDINQVYDGDPNSPTFGQPTFSYNFTAPEKGNVTAKIVPGKGVEPITVQFKGALDAIHYETDQVYPGGEIFLYVQDGYYLQTTYSDPNYDPDLNDEEGCNGFHLNVWQEAKRVTVTVNKAVGALNIDDPEGHLWWTGMANDSEYTRFSEPTLGMKAGTHINVALDGNAALVFPDGEPEDLNDNYEVFHDEWNDWNEHNGQTVHYYNFTAPDHELNVQVVEGEAPETITVQFEGETDAIHYENDQVYPGGEIFLFVQDGYYLRTTFSDPNYDPNLIDYQDDGCNGFHLNVWPDAESVTVTVCEATGRLNIDDPEGRVWWTNMNSDDENVRFSDPVFGMEPGTYISISLAADAALEFPDGAPEDLNDHYEVNHDEWNEHNGQTMHQYNFTAPEGDLNAQVVKGREPITVQFEGEVDAIHYETDQVYPNNDLILSVQDGYYLQTTFSDPNSTGEVDEDGCNVIDLYVWQEAEEVTVTVCKAAGKLILDTEDPALRGWWTDGEENVRMGDPTLGFAPGAGLNVTVANGYAVLFEGAAEVDDVTYYNIDTDPNSPFYGDPRLYYYCTAPEEGDVTATIVEIEPYKVVPVNYVDEYDAIGYKGDFPSAVAGWEFPLGLAEGYTVEVEGGQYYSEYDELYVYEDADEVTITAVPIVRGATLTIEGETDAVIPDSEKEDLGLVGFDGRYLLSDGDVLEDGTGHILVKDGYKVTAESGALVELVRGFYDNDFTALYYDYYVTATDEAPVVTVEEGEGYGRIISATVANEDEADFQFTNAIWRQMEDGTYRLITSGSVAMIVEDGYELEVEGATYQDSALDEETGELVRIYALDEGAESITVTVVPVDKSALEIAIDVVEAMAAYKDDFTPESWAAVEEALEYAKVVNEKKAATQAEVDEAIEAMVDAVDALVVATADKTELNAAIEAADALVEEVYTAESWAPFAEALAAAKEVAADEYAFKSEVAEALAALTEAQAALVKNPVDKTALATAITAAEALKEADYTPATWAPFAAALTAAKTVNTDVNATQEAVDAAAKALADAQAALLKTADKLELEVAIAVAAALEEADFTPASWAAASADIAAALAAANAVDEDANATQAAVDAAVEALVAALNKLVDMPAAPKSGTGWVEADDGIYFYQKGALKKSFWVGKADGASQWDGNWYYVGADGKLATGMHYIDDLHGGAGWYFLQPTNKNGEIGKMLTGWQWVGVQGDVDYGTCYFSSKAGSSGKCTYSSELGDWNGATWGK